MPTKRISSPVEAPGASEPTDSSRERRDAFQGALIECICGHLNAPTVPRCSCCGQSFRPAKYGNRTVERDGYRFDSQAETARYQELRLLEQSGQISDLVVHPRFELLPKEAAGRAVVYIADFSYRAHWPARGEIVEDVKGVETAVFRLKARLFRAKYPDVSLRVVKR